MAAINADYGSRSEFETKFGEIFLVLDCAHDAAKRLKGWMRPRRRRVDLMAFAGARNRLIPQPLGVVGVIVPWNYPLMLSFGPLVSIFAAGNRAMVKMSENSRRLAELLIELSPKYFPEDKLAFFDDGGGRGPGVLLAAVRSSDLHGFGRNRPRRDGQRGAQSDAGDARTRRQVAGDRRRPTSRSRRRPSASCGPRPSTPARPASPSTTSSCRAARRPNSSSIASACSPSAIRTSTARTSPRSSTSAATIA